MFLKNLLCRRTCYDYIRKKLVQNKIFIVMLWNSPKRSGRKNLNGCIHKQRSPKKGRLFQQCHPSFRNKIICKGAPFWTCPKFVLHMKYFIDDPKCLTSRPVTNLYKKFRKQCFVLLCDCVVIYTFLLKIAHFALYIEII